MKDIGGRVAVVTGASRGIGPYIAEALFGHGMKVVLAARDAKALEATRRRLDRTGTRTIAVAMDVTNETARDALLGAARKSFGQVDVLVNNAGTDRPAHFVETDFETVRQMVELNVLSLMRLTQMALPDMLRRASGHIVNIASMAGLAPVPNAVAYAATKHAVVGFSESLRYELEGSGVSVSVVCPYFVREAGLFHSHSGGEYGGAQTASPQDVANGVVRAIVRDRARVIVGPVAVKGAPLLRAISPDLIWRAQKAEGSAQKMRRMAEIRRNQPAVKKRVQPAATEENGAEELAASGAKLARGSKGATPEG
jgi:short-subunit dehydrogenase